jgi:hypothetical protein
MGESSPDCAWRSGLERTASNGPSGRRCCRRRRLCFCKNAAYRFISACSEPDGDTAEPDGDTGSHACTAPPEPPPAESSSLLSRWMCAINAVRHSLGASAPGSVFAPRPAPGSSSPCAAAGSASPTASVAAAGASPRGDGGPAPAAGGAGARPSSSCLIRRTRSAHVASGAPSGDMSGAGPERQAAPPQARPGPSPGRCSRVAELGRARSSAAAGRPGPGPLPSPGNTVEFATVKDREGRDQLRANSRDDMNGLGGSAASQRTPGQSQAPRTHR